MAGNDDGIEDLQLSAETLKVLQNFYKEEHQRLLNELSTNHNDFEEKWQLSQFWYDTNTINDLANIAVKSVGSNGKIALVSCPSLYKRIKEICKPEIEVTLFEYDKRFERYGKDYVFYDYNTPLNLPKHLKSYYNLVIADPPFLSEECLEKTSETIRFLTQEQIILNTGEVMEKAAKQLLNVTKSSLKLSHTRNLANEIQCFTNFDIEHLLIYNKEKI